MGINSPLLSISPISMMTRGKGKTKFNSIIYLHPQCTNASSWKAKSISLNSQSKSLLTWIHCLITAQAHSKFHLSSSLSLSQEYQSSIDLHHSYIILVSPNIMPTKTSSSYWLKPVLILLLQILFLSIWFIISILYHLPISYYFNKIYFPYPVRPTTGYINLK